MTIFNNKIINIRIFAGAIIFFILLLCTKNINLYAANNVSVYISSKCFNGYTLFSHMGFEHSYTNIYLINMQGDIEHIWHADQQPHKSLINHNSNLVFCTSLYEGKGPGMQELDIKGNRLWEYDIYNQHDFRYVSKDKILVEFYDFTETETNFIQNPKMQIIDIANNNNVIWEWKFKDHIDEFKKLYPKNFTMANDWAHNNSCAIIPENTSGRIDKRFKKGNIIFSFNFLDVIGIIDYPSGEIVWLWGKDTLNMQHSPEMQKNGRIIIFDNGVNTGWSRIIELDPINETITWQWPKSREDAKKYNFYTEHAGNIDILPNGNLLVCSADQSRIFELTRSGELVWDFESTFYIDYGGERTAPTARRYSKKQLKALFKNIKKSKKELKKRLKK